jgi:hypothetical protein
MAKAKVSPKATVASRSTAAKHSITPTFAFVGPLVAFLIAGLTKLVDWKVGWLGIALLVGFAAMGLCLQYIPRQSVAWRTKTGSTEATLKQSIATMRVAVSTVMVFFIVSILGTSDQVLEALPSSIENLLKAPDDIQTFNGGVASVVLEPKTTNNVLFFLPVPGAVPEPAVLKFRSSNQQVTHSAGASGDTPVTLMGELYILQTTKFVQSVMKAKIRPMFHIVAITAFFLSSIFVFVIFLMEVFGDLLMRYRPKSKT